MKVIWSTFILAFTVLQMNAQQMKHEILEKSIFQDSLTQKKVILLDVRRPEEFNEGRIEKAQNINVLDSLNFRNQIDILSRDTPVYIYCKSGNRSNKAAITMQEMGFKTIYDLEGGYLNWISEEE